MLSCQNAFIIGVIFSSYLHPVSDFNFSMILYTWCVRTTRFLGWKKWSVWKNLLEYYYSKTSPNVCLARQPDGLGRRGLLDISTCPRDQRKPESNKYCKCYDSLTYLIWRFKAVIRGRQNVVSNSKQSVVICLVFNLLLSDENTFHKQHWWADGANKTN